MTEASQDAVILSNRVHAGKTGSTRSVAEFTEVCVVSALTTNLLELLLVNGQIIGPIAAECRKDMIENVDGLIHISSKPVLQNLPDVHPEDKVAWVLETFLWARNAKAQSGKLDPHSWKPFAGNVLISKSRSIGGWTKYRYWGPYPMGLFGPIRTCADPYGSTRTLQTPTHSFAGIWIHASPRTKFQDCVQYCWYSHVYRPFTLLCFALLCFALLLIKAV